MSKRYFMYGIKVPVELLENEAFLEKIKLSKYTVSNKNHNNLSGSFVIVGKRMYSEKSSGDGIIVPELHDSVKELVELHIDAILTEFKIEKNDKYYYYYIIEE